MSQENVDIARQLNEAVRRRDMEVHVLKLRNGKVTQLREYHSKAEALEAVGLPE